MDAEQKGTLSKAYLGKSKDCLDLIDVSIELNTAVNSFGPFIKFVVDSGVPSTRAETSQTSKSAFDVLMSAQQFLSLPKRIEVEKMTKKELLYNDVIQCIEKQDLTWNVSTLFDVLWYIDGHHVFEKQGCKLPDFVSSFVAPETSKHGKRSVINMSGLALSVHASSLYGCLQSLYWRRPKFAKLKPAIEQLSRCLAQYGDYLQSQNKRMKQAHASPTSIRQLSDSLSIDIIKKSPHLCFQCFGELCSTLRDINNYQHLCLTDLCPNEPRSSSLPVYTEYSLILLGLILLSGNNRGNMHFIWKFDDSELLETVFQKSLPVVELIKPLLPQYHTRAMQKSLLSKYGCVFRCQTCSVTGILQRSHW